MWWQMSFREVVRSRDCIDQGFLISVQSAATSSDMKTKTVLNVEVDEDSHVDCSDRGWHLGWRTRVVMFIRICFQFFVLYFVCGHHGVVRCECVAG